MIYLILINVIGSAYAQTHYLQCMNDPARQQQRSEELQALVDADQADRQGSPDSIDWSKVAPRDLQRRIRVAEIFAEGCFKTAKDYAAAAMVYQHGDAPDHFYQTFIWSKKAVDLGDVSQRWLMAAGLDRYLVRIGQKQLFATQGGKDSPTAGACWCLEPVEESFPEDRRIEYGKRTLKEALAWIDSLNAEKPSCSKSQYCNHLLKASPIGTVPGFW